MSLYVLFLLVGWLLEGFEETPLTTAFYDDRWYTVYQLPGPLRRPFKAIGALTTTQTLALGPSWVSSIHALQAQKCWEFHLENWGFFFGWTNRTGKKNGDLYHVNGDMNRYTTNKTGRLQQSCGNFMGILWDHDGIIMGYRGIEQDLVGHAYMYWFTIVWWSDWFISRGRNWMVNFS